MVHHSYFIINGKEKERNKICHTLLCLDANCTSLSSGYDIVGYGASIAVSPDL
jgi:hypothetical protein